MTQTDKAAADMLRELRRGVGMIHDGLADPKRPRQSVGEVAAWWLRYADQCLGHLAGPTAITAPEAQPVVGMPPRIWAWAWDVDIHRGQWSEDREIVGEGVEYIRADLALPQDAESLRAEVERLTAERDEWRGHVASANHERNAAQSDAREAAQIPSLMAVIDRLTADLATSRAETAMAFEVAAEAACRALNACLMDGMAMFVAERVAPAIMSSIPADATAALAARDKAKDDRIAELEAEIAALQEAATPVETGPISTLEAVYSNMPDIPELPEACQPRNIAKSLAALRAQSHHGDDK